MLLRCMASQMNPRECYCIRHRDVERSNAISIAVCTPASAADLLIGIILFRADAKFFITC